MLGGCRSAVATYVALNLIYSVILIFGIGRGFIPTASTLFFVETVGAMAAVYLVLIKGRRFSWADLGWTPSSTAWLILGGAAAVAMNGLISSITVVWGRFTGLTMVELIPAPPTLTPNSMAGFFATFALLTVAVPIVEEFLFLGVLFRWLRDTWSLYTGLVGSALIFSLVHVAVGGPGSPLPIFLAGLALAYLYGHTGSLKPSMVFHGVNNGISLVLIYLVTWSGAS